MNAVRLDLHYHFKIHLVEHVSHTMSFLEQSVDISLSIPINFSPTPTIHGVEHVVENIISYRNRRKRSSFSYS